MKTKEKVITLLRENIDWDGEIKMEHHLRNDLGIDSFGILMTINSLEDEYGIEIEDADLDGLKTVSDIVFRLEEILPVQKF
jgi:acyl carrier protein